LKNIKYRTRYVSKNLSGAERSGGAEYQKIGGAVRSAPSAPLKPRSTAPRILNPAPASGPTYGAVRRLFSSVRKTSGVAIVRLQIYLAVSVELQDADVVDQPTLSVLWMKNNPLSYNSDSHFS
jgi:hypothetical protein